MVNSPIHTIFFLKSRNSKIVPEVCQYFLFGSSYSFNYSIHCRLSCLIDYIHKWIYVENIIYNIF